MTNITQDPRLRYKNLLKIKVWPNTKEIKAHWDKLYWNLSYWDSGEESATSVIKSMEVTGIKTMYMLHLIRLISSICVKLWGVQAHWDNIWPIWNIMGKSTEVLINITQDPRLVCEILLKIQILTWNTRHQGSLWKTILKSMLLELRWRSLNRYYSEKGGLKYQNSVYTPNDWINKIPLFFLWCIKAHLDDIWPIWSIFFSLHNCWPRSPRIRGYVLKTLEYTNLTHYTRHQGS